LAWLPGLDRLVIEGLAGYPFVEVVLGSLSVESTVGRRITELVWLGVGLDASGIGESVWGMRTCNE
jgi:hypothetical protein